VNESELSNNVGYFLSSMILLYITITLVINAQIDNVTLADYSFIL